jgi:hypothetical protein
MDQPPRDPASTIPWAIPRAGGGADGSPKFGRLLAVLICAVLMIVVITFASEAYFLVFGRISKYFGMDLASYRGSQDYAWIAQFSSS